MDLGTQANEANAEVFMNACTIWAFALLARADQGSGWLPRAVLTGAALALASLYKPITVVSAALLALVHVALPPAGVQARRRALAQAAVMAGVGVLTWAALCAFYAAAGRFADFYGTVFAYNRFYAGSVLGNIRLGLTRTTLLPACVYPFVGLAGAGVLGLLADLGRRPRAWVLWVALLVSGHLETCLPGKFWPHYYQLWFPPLVVGAGWGVVALGRALVRLLRFVGRIGNPSGRIANPSYEKKWHGRLAPLPGALCLAYVVCFAGPRFPLSADEWSVRKYGPASLQVRDVARVIETRLLEPGESFYQFGPHSELYFLTGRRPPSGIIFYLAWMFDGPLGQTFSDRQFRQVTENRPELLVVHRPLMALAPPHAHRVLTNYEPIEGYLDEPLRAEYSLWALRGGALAGRLRKAGVDPAVTRRPTQGPPPRPNT
jgi:hypothetical protein